MTLNIYNYIKINLYHIFMSNELDVVVIMESENTLP